MPSHLVSTFQGIWLTARALPPIRLVVILVLFWAPSACSQENPVLAWNGLILGAIRAETTPPTLASRNLAILHTAIYDAVNSVEQTSQPYRFSLPPDGESSDEAAAVAAAHSVMVVLYASLRATFDQAYQQFLNSSADTPARSNGLHLGRLIGALTVDSRSGDGASTDIPYIPSEAPGDWRRTPPFFRPPLDPQWGLVDAFCLPDLEPVMPTGPPALDTETYAADFDMVQALGGQTSALRDPEQTLIARFWSDFSYTATPPGHWQEIAAAIVRNQGNSLPQTARLFALLSLAQADAAVAVWEAKYRYNFWRPVTANDRAENDYNPETQPEEAWLPLLVTPPFPEYPSGHSTFSKASATVLARFYDTDHISFSIGTDALPGVTRSFESLSACADEVGLSRIYGGIHFMSANIDGKRCGEKIGEYVSTNFLLPHEGLPRLTIESRDSQSITLCLHGRIGKTGVLEGSTDLQNWEELLSEPFVVGGLRVQELLNSQFPGRVFRLREL